MRRFIRKAFLYGSMQQSKPQSLCRQSAVRFSCCPESSKDALDLAADTAEMWVWFLIQKLTVYEYS